VGAHRYVSALSAEIAGGTLPEKRFSQRILRRNVLIRRAESAGRPHGRRRGVHGGQPGERRDARRDRAGEAVLGQEPDRAQRGMRPQRRWRSHALALRRMRRIGGEPGRAKGTHMAVSAVSTEIVGGRLPEKRFSVRLLHHSVPVRTRPSRPRDRTGGGGAYREASLVSAVTLARIGPLKLFLLKYLITHTEACGHTERPTHAQALRSRCDAGAASAASPAVRRGRTSA
jgi:hypothetical protein